MSPFRFGGRRLELLVGSDSQVREVTEVAVPEDQHSGAVRAPEDQARDERARSPSVPAPREGAERQESVGQLLQELSRDTSHLVRQEIRLAQAEMTQKAKLAGLSAGLLGAAAVLGLAMLGAATAAMIAAIAILVPVWAAALAVTVFYGLLIGGLALVAWRELRRASPLKPEQTVETLKDDAAWARTRARSART